MTVLPDSLHDRPARPVPAWAFVLVLLGGLLASLAAVLGLGSAMLSAVYVLLTDGVFAALILLSAGGWGHLLCRRFLPEDTPLPLRLATAAGVGLWLLGTAMLLVGSTVRGSLTGLVWWPMVVLGVLAALWQGRSGLRRAWPATAPAQGPAGSARPTRVGLSSLVWVVAALAAGLALAGAVLPAGWLGGTTADSYDILEYHLQLPREYLDNGLIATLPHNVYSFYPLGMEMLFLLGMCLRGSADGGMYLAQMMPALFGVVAIGAVYGMACWHNSKDAGGPARPARFAGLAGAVLLASAPWLIYLCGLALVEAAQIAYLALALAWLAAWLRRRDTASAVLLGAMLGASCCIKYLSVGLIVGPVLAVMLVGGLWAGRGRVARSLGQCVLAGAVTLAVFSPWLVRNALAVGNPVFPLANDLLGRGHWMAEQDLRWRNGHAPGQHPPVPTPEGWQFPPQEQSRLSRLLNFWLGQGAMGWLQTALPRFLPAQTARDIAGGGRITGPELSPAILLLFLGGVAAMLRGNERHPPAVPGASKTSPGPAPARRSAVTSGAGGFIGSRFGKPPALRGDVLLGVIVLQMAAWAMFTHEMPNRFAAVAVVPVVLLAALGLGRLAQWRPGRFGRVAAGVLLLVAAGTNLLCAKNYLESELALAAQRQQCQDEPPAGIDPSLFRSTAQPAGTRSPGRFMLVGTSSAYYFPRGTLYATVFDTHPLQGVLANWQTGESVAGRLRASGVSDMWVNWAEIRRLRTTYGWPEELSPALIEGIFAEWPMEERLARASGVAATQSAALPTDQLIFTHYRVPAPPANAAPLTLPATRPAGRKPPKPPASSADGPGDGSAHNPPAMQGDSKQIPPQSGAWAATRPASTAPVSFENDLSNPPS